MVTRELQALLDVLQEPCFILQQDGEVLAANKAASATLGMRNGEIKGRRLQALATNAPEDIRSFLARSVRSTSPAVGALAMSTIRGQPVEFRIEGTRFQPADDSKPLVFLRLTPRSNALSQFEGLNERLVALGREVSRRRLAEVALANKVAELNEAANNKNRFLATLSHELRNPLSPIRNGVYLLMGRLSDQQRGEIVGMLERNVGHLVRLLDDLLDVSRVTNGKLSLRIGRASLDELIELAVESVRHRLESTGQTLDVRIGEPIFLRADADRVRQIIANLLENAAKYSPEGSRISLTAQVEQGQAAIRVVDSGPGVPPELQGRLFQFFEQGGHPGTHATGLGLGLALSRALAEMQGGCLDLESHPNPGACFCLLLPLDGAAIAESTSAPVAS